RMPPAVWTSRPMLVPGPVPIASWLMPFGPNGFVEVSPSWKTRPRWMPSWLSQKPVRLDSASVGPVHGSWKRSARAAVRLARAWEATADAPPKLTLPQPGSWTTVAVTGAVVMFPKNGVVPVAILNVVADSVPVAYWNVPLPPVRRWQEVCSTSVAWKRMSIALGSMLVPVWRWARVRPASAVSVSPVSGAYP